LLQALGLARVKYVAPTPRFMAPRLIPNLQTLQAVITHRYDVLAQYAKSLKLVHAEEVRKLREVSPEDARALQALEPWLHRDETKLPETERIKVVQTLSKSRALQTAYSMRRYLMALWERSTASNEQLVRRLQDWCQRAEASGIAPLVGFSQRLRCYV
jgi:stearoyl-CoA desaturase (delta-9 desaturase)